MLPRGIKRIRILQICYTLGATIKNLFYIGGMFIGDKTEVVKETYSISEIAKILDISNKSAYSLIRENFFRYVRIGRTIRISKKSFDQWLNDFADADDLTRRDF